MTDNMDSSDTWLIVPCYNEGQVIHEVLEHAHETFPNIVAVNDGSSDNSSLEIHRADVHLVNHPVSLGQGAAIQADVEYVRAQAGLKYSVTFGAGGQHQVKDVIAMVQRLRTEPIDITAGTCFGRRRAEDDQVPLIKRIALRTVVMLSPRTRRLGLTDAHNDLRALNRVAAEQLNLRMNGMSHVSEFAEIMDSRSWCTTEQPVDTLYAEYSMSKGQSLLNGVNIPADSLISKRLP